MQRSKAEIEAAFRRARWNTALRELRRSGAVIALCVVLAGFALYWIATPSEFLGIRSGVIVGSHQIPSDDGPSSISLKVRLDDGSHISAVLSRGVPFKPDEKVQVELRRRAWWPHFNKSRVRKYESDGAQPEGGNRISQQDEYVTLKEMLPYTVKFLIAYWNAPSVDHYGSIEEALSDFLAVEGQTGEMALREEIRLLLSDDPQYLEKLNSPGLGMALGGMGLPREEVERMLAALSS